MRAIRFYFFRLAPRKFTAAFSLKLALFCMLTLLYPPLASAQMTETAAASASTFSDSNWFFYISAGVGQPSYDSETTADIDRSKSLGLESPEAGFFDLPGVYRKLRPGLAVGAVLAMSFENYARKWRDPEAFAIQTFNPSLSVFWFPLSEEIGRGWFGRADLGKSRIQERWLTNGQNGIDPTNTNRDGVFAQIAVGYGWEASSFARVLVHVNGIYSSARPNSMNALTLNIGFLL